MQINKIIEFLENFSPLEFQEDYDNSGLLVGNAEEEITAALVSLDITTDVIQEAIDKNCNLIIAHHPIIFKGLKSITGKNYVEKSIIMAIKNNIAIYAIHTNLDNVTGGVNFKIAETLGLENIKILSPKNDKATVGSGAIGTLKKAINANDFLALVKNKMKAPVIRHTQLVKQEIKTIAVCGGTGSFLLGEAKKQKADVFLTADFKYHEFFDAENQIIIADIGHFESEQYTKDLLVQLLSNKFANFATYLSVATTNPVQYYF